MKLLPLLFGVSLIFPAFENRDFQKYFFPQLDESSVSLSYYRPFSFNWLACSSLQFHFAFLGKDFEFDVYHSGDEVFRETASSLKITEEFAGLRAAFRANLFQINSEAHSLPKAFSFGSQLEKALSQSLLIGIELHNIWQEDNTLLGEIPRKLDLYAKLKFTESLQVDAAFEDDFVQNSNIRANLWKNYGIFGISAGLQSEPPIMQASIHFNKLEFVCTMALFWHKDLGQSTAFNVSWQCSGF